MLAWLFKRSLVGKHAPDISGQKWFNETALPEAVREKVKRGESLDIRRDLAGYVVLIDFWDYDCIHCINAMPHLREWWQKYKDRKFLIIGVHTPEFEFAKDPEKVESAVLRFELNYPVVSDPDYTTWERYRTKAWPRELIIDAQGMVRYDHTGEGDYEAKENIIQQLLK